MNYNPNYNNPQQPWNQQPPRPQPPKRSPWVIIIIAIAVISVGGLFYFVSTLGRKAGDAIVEAAKSLPLDSMIEESYTQTESQKQAYERIKNEVRYNTALPDSLKNEIYNRLYRLENSTASAYFTLRYYNRGFNDTVRGKEVYYPMDEIWGNAYFIQTGRAQEYKQSLLDLKNDAFMDLPESERDSSLLNILFVNENIDWENLEFNQDVSTVRMNLNSIHREIGEYERAILDCYHNSLKAHKIGYSWHP